MEVTRTGVIPACPLMRWCFCRDAVQIAYFLPLVELIHGAIYVGKTLVEIAHFGANGQLLAIVVVTGLALVFVRDDIVYIHLMTRLVDPRYRSDITYHIINSLSLIFIPNIGSCFPLITIVDE